jgi:HEAT repeat protein
MMTTSVKRIVAYNISRLKDKSREVRLKAIQDLAQYPDEEALDALKLVVEKDTDIEVRKAAQEAGRAVFLKLKT